MEVEKTTKSSMGQFRKWFFYILIGGLVVSAVIAIIAVLVGEMNELVIRSLGTTLIMAFHAAVGVGFFAAASNSKNSAADDVVYNTLIGLTVASFITSVLSIWEVITGPIVSNLYELYFDAFLASVLVFCLLHARMSDPATGMSAKISIGTTIAFLAYLIPGIFAETGSLPAVYDRGVAAFAILLSTSVVITLIFHWVYAIKHRDEIEAERAARAKDTKGWHSLHPLLKVLVVLVTIFIAMPVVIVLLAALVGVFARLV